MYIRKVKDRQIAIPAHLRQALHLNDGDYVKLDMLNEGVILTKYKPLLAAGERSRFAASWLKSYSSDIKAVKASFRLLDDVTKCEVGSNNGWAKRNPKDPYDANIGMVISFCRAIDWQIPEELL